MSLAGSRGEMTSFASGEWQARRCRGGSSRQFGATHKLRTKSASKPTAEVQAQACMCLLIVLEQVTTGRHCTSFNGTWGVGAPDEMMIVASMVTGREASAKRNGLHERLPIIVESPYDVPQSLAH
ncbi:hypothetical protein SCLCIDRAFT_1222763 [Scleroderma citrinum Foug A]|uniref:Uncharacterized protein n=1 Tax=Scleroderma citrinum Foug A TaxID=1036808 RepID=A0A0C2YUX4_9AGAM|nr:hypothetical protein SCLCIDRAFT_1222763 [Scleroderma citrinum Foug A]